MLNACQAFLPIFSTPEKVVNISLVVAQAVAGTSDTPLSHPNRQGAWCILNDSCQGDYQGTVAQV